MSQRCRVTTLLALLVASLLATAAVPAYGQERGNPNWFVRVGGYLWLSNIDGSNTAANIDVPVTDSVLEASWAMRLEVGKWRLRAIVDLSRAALANSLLPSSSGGLSGFYDFSMTTFEFRGAAQIGSFSSRQAVEVYGGVRHVRQQQDLRLTAPVVDESVTESWTEPIFGSRYFAEVGRRFWFSMLIDVGGLSIGSDFTWVLDGELGFRLSPPVDLTFRYRYMETQYDNGKSGSEAYVWDGGQAQGWFLGVVFNR